MSNDTQDADLMGLKEKFNLSDAEVIFIGRIQTLPNDQQQAMAEQAMETAVRVELATIPLYLYTYYSIDRTGGGIGDDSPLVRFGNRAGATLMSVAVEEMLHLSLSSNIYHALTGKPPKIYKQSPTANCSSGQAGHYPVLLPGHKKLQGTMPCFPLDNFSADQLLTFLEIELPELNADPQYPTWETIGELYNAAKCVILAAGVNLNGVDKRYQQIQHYNYTPNCIDTIYPKEKYDKTLDPSQTGSAAKSAKYMNSAKGHEGQFELITIGSKQDALTAIATICEQGEGLLDQNVQVAESPEKTHFFKFLCLQSQLVGWENVDKILSEYSSGDFQHWVADTKDSSECWHDTNPEPFSASEVLQNCTHKFPRNPTINPAAQGEDITRYSALSDWELDTIRFANGLYQYMLVLTESIFVVHAQKTAQRKYFNQAMHMSMIWVMDKLFGTMRGVVNSVDGGPLVPTFETQDLGTREDAFSGLQQLAVNLQNSVGKVGWSDQNHSAANSILSRVTSHLTAPNGEWAAPDSVRTLPDVTGFWNKDNPVDSVGWPELIAAGITQPSDPSSC